MARTKQYEQKRKALMQKRKRHGTRAIRTWVPRTVNPGYTRTGGYFNRPEIKFFDTLLSDPISSTGEVADGSGLNLIPQGTTESNRDGRKCTITSINMKGYLTKNNGGPSAVYNIALVLDTQANGAYPDYTDVFETDTPDSHLNLANSQRFRVLKRWYGTMNALTVNNSFTNWGETRKVLSFNKKCNIPLEFSSTTGAITEIRSNNLLVMWDCDLNDAISANMNFRLRFTG